MMARVIEPASSQPMSTEAVMADVRDRVRATLHATLVARGATELEEREVLDEVEALFRRGLALDDRQALLLPHLLDEPWRPELSIRAGSHRGRLTAAAVTFVKRRVLQPLNRWLFEYAQENFRRQARLNHALLACLQAVAADHARVKQRLAALEAAQGDPPR
jgi:hypothetical protein